MIRCPKSVAFGMLLPLGAALPVATLLLSFSLPAQAQTVTREAPKDVKFGRMAVATPPDVTINGQAERLSPGARIRAVNNLLMLPASLAGQTVPVVYRRDLSGLVHEVWLLTEEEATRLGNGDGDGQGYQRFAELLNLIFGARR